MKTKVLKIDPNLPDKNTIEFAATLLRDGGLVAFPTETVYGIGANFQNKETIKRLYEIKRRPFNKPFTIHISSVDTITQMRCEISPLADQLIKKFWPGPLTIVLKMTHSTYQVAKGDLVSRMNTLAFRMPKNSIAKELISKAGVPVVAPSANISGGKPPTETDEILKMLDGKIDLILDSGKTEFGRESTIVDTTSAPYKILRKGAIAESEIKEVLDTD